MNILVKLDRQHRYYLLENKRNYQQRMKYDFKMASCILNILLSSLLNLGSQMNMNNLHGPVSSNLRKKSNGHLLVTTIEPDNTLT